jgi:hypothetical protein
VTPSWPWRAAERRTGTSTASADADHRPGDTGAEGDLVEPYRSMRFVSHVESKVAAYMRRNKIRQAVLSSNMRPCRDFDGCKANIRATLPVG